MKAALLSLGLLCVFAPLCAAGPNVNGVLVIHANESVGYTGTIDYCSEEHQPGGDIIPADCESLVTEIHRYDAPTLLWLLWAFEEGSNPSVDRIVFGVEHDLPPGEGYVVDWDACGPVSTVIVEPGTPDAPGGILIQYAVPVEARLFPVVWSAVYGDREGAVYGGGVHPTFGEATFTAPGYPPVEDPIRSFGYARWGSAGQNLCPPQPGACCFDDGSCEVLLAVDCAALGGSYTEDRIACDADPCPPAEACCYDSGHCEPLLPEVCDASGGTSLGPGTLCDPNPCEQPQACCFADGTCEPLLVEFCNQAGGEPMGEGSVCHPNPCPQLGACCNERGGCRLLLEEDCTDIPGFMGEGIPCDPNPCKVGACCYLYGLDLRCEMLAEEACGHYWGANYLGDNIPCSMEACLGDSIACCFDDGSCARINPIDCFTSGGEPSDGEPFYHCGPPNPCPRACCFPDGTCEMRNLGRCNSLGGTPLDEGTRCEDDPCPITISVPEVELEPLLGVSPNPFVAECRIAYDVAEEGSVSIEIYDTGGRLVRRLPQGHRGPGRQIAVWNGRDDRGDLLPTGVYLARVLTPSGSTARRLALLR